MTRRSGMVVRVLLTAGVLAVGAWCCLAVFLTMAGPDWLRWGITGCVAAAVLSLVVAWRSGVARSVAAIAVLGVAAWWISLTPSNARDWEPEYQRVATATLQDDVVTVHDIRNATYTRDGEARPAYYDARFDLATLSGVDLVTSYWAGESIAHVFLSFGFSDGRHLAISVETRRERGEAYSAIAGFFRRYELMYVVADERDLIGVRTDVRRERVYLFPLTMTAAERRGLFLSYVDRIRTLRDRPEFYDTATNNCTTNVLARANAAAGLIPNSWKVLVSGYADSYAYDLGRIDTTAPFATVKRRSQIVRPPGAEIGPAFSAEIRRGHAG